MNVYAKNNTAEEMVLRGNVVAAGEYVGVPQAERAAWAADSNLLQSITDGDVVIAKTDDGLCDISDPAQQWAYLGNNIPPTVKTHAVMEGDTLRARLKGTHNATVTAGTTQDIDWQIEQMQYLGSNKDSYMDGINYIVSNENFGDTITLQVVDKDNVLGFGAGTVLDEFGCGWQVNPGGEVIRLYKAKLITGLYIRIKYTSTGSTDVKFAANLFRHMDAS